MSIGRFSFYLFIFLLALGWSISLQFIQARQDLFKLIEALFFVCALTCTFIGIYMAIDWVDPFQGADTSRAATLHGGRGGLFIMMIRWWPYMLIALGGYISYNCLHLVKQFFNKK